MVRFAPHLAPFLLVREQLPFADQYRRADASVSGSVEEVEVAALAPAPVEDSEVPAPVCDDGVPIPDPLDDADSLGELEAKITILAAHIHAATHRLLTLIAEFDQRRGWELGGIARAPTGFPSAPGSIWARPARRCARHGCWRIFPRPAPPWPGASCPFPRSGR